MPLSLGLGLKYKLFLQLLVITFCLFICCVIYRLPQVTTPSKMYDSKNFAALHYQNLANFCPPGYSDDSFKSRMDEEQRRRRDHVTDVCNKTQRKRRFRMSMTRNILVDDVHRVLYCVIPKVACTTLKKYFVQISPFRKREKRKKVNVHDWRSLRKAGYNYLHTYNRTEIHYRLENYFKFMFVRDPFRRLLSAYREKFQKRNKYTIFFHRTFGQTIISRYRLNSSIESRWAGSDVRFEEFIQYILELKDRDEEFNPHWDSYHDLCYPCTIPYDYIGKLETMQQDTQYLVQKISNSTHCQRIPTLFVRSPTTESFMKKYYAKIGPAAIEELRQLYSLDFELFNYTELPLDAKHKEINEI